MSRKSTVLIVDDEPSGRKNLKVLLMPQGYNIAVACNGAEALQLAAELLPDVILLDVMMPDMDGFEVCRRLRANPVLAEVPVIMLTALDDRSSRLEGIEAGADDFISKPFDRTELRLRVETITRLNRYQHLMRERAKFEWAIEQAEDGYIITNKKDEILYANPQARTYLGIPLEDAISQTFSYWVQRQFSCEPNNMWANWPGPFSEPLYLIKTASKNSRAFWVQIDLMEMDTTGDEVSYLVRLRDVSAAMDEKRSNWTFHALISHKLRTPLFPLVASLDILQEKYEPLFADDAYKLLEMAYQSALRVHDDIQEILHYLETPEMVFLNRGRCSLSTILSTIRELEKSLEFNPVTIHCETSQDLSNAYIGLAREAIELILLELFKNAKKFHPQQSPNIEVVISDNDKTVEINVVDDGQPLSPEHLDKIWAPYYQGERYFTGQVAGIGLGLSKVASLVWEVGGTCRAYNRLEQPGLVIEIKLPLVYNESRVEENNSQELPVMAS